MFKSTEKILTAYVKRKPKKERDTRQFNQVIVCKDKSISYTDGYIAFEFSDEKQTEPNSFMLDIRTAQDKRNGVKVPVLPNNTLAPNIDRMLGGTFDLESETWETSLRKFISQVKSLGLDRKDNVNLKVSPKTLAVGVATCEGWVTVNYDKLMTMLRVIDSLDNSKGRNEKVTLHFRGDKRPLGVQTADFKGIIAPVAHRKN